MQKEMTNSILRRFWTSFVLNGLASISGHCLLGRSITEDSILLQDRLGQVIESQNSKWQYSFGKV